jgi:hypothetical protein
LRHTDSISRQHDERFASLALPDAGNRQPLHGRRCRVGATGGRVEGERLGSCRHVEGLSDYYGFAKARTAKCYFHLTQC